jgi:predicted RNase H-like HicB family nuclease
MDYDILVHEEDGVFVAGCKKPEVAGCGDTRKEAPDNIMEAIGLYLIMPVNWVL